MKALAHRRENSPGQQLQASRKRKAQEETSVVQQHVRKTSTKARKLEERALFRQSSVC